MRCRLRLVHEGFQVDTALVSCHSHHRVSLSLVTFIKQLWDKPNIKARFIYVRRHRNSPAGHHPSPSWQAGLQHQLPAQGHPPFPGVALLRHFRVGAPILGPLAHSEIT